MKRKLIVSDELEVLFIVSQQTNLLPVLEMCQEDVRSDVERWVNRGFTRPRLSHKNDYGRIFVDPSAPDFLERIAEYAQKYSFNSTITIEEESK